MANYLGKMPQYKLTYFNFTGFGEPVRFMLSFLGKDWQDCRVSMEEWVQLKEKTPFGKLPILKFDGRVLHQSLAILRYLASEAGLAGNTLQETLEIDMVVGAFGDLTSDILRYFRMKDPKEKEKLKEFLINDTIPFYMSRFETILKKNGGYLANGKLSWAEFYVVGFSSSIPSLLGIDLAEKYPFFKDLVERVQSLPGIKEWIKKRPVIAV